MQSKKISDIDLRTHNWKELVHLTFDFDWASDFILTDTLDILEKFDVSATFFVTHNTPVLERIRMNPKFELGIHPNFDDFLTARVKLTEENAESRILEIKQVVPEAVSWRSHSTTNSSRLLNVACKLGLIYDCNYLIPYTSNIVLQPWRLWNNMIRCPYYYEDDVSLEYKLEEKSIAFLLEREGLKIFDFHPIHIYLNTNKLSDYEASREIHNSQAELLAVRQKSPGVRNKLYELLNLVGN